MNDETKRHDQGLLINKTVLPITEVCMGYDKNAKAGKREATMKIWKFVCRPDQAGESMECNSSKTKRVYE